MGAYDRGSHKESLLCDLNKGSGTYILLQRYIHFFSLGIQKKLKCVDESKKTANRKEITPNICTKAHSNSASSALLPIYVRERMVGIRAKRLTESCPCVLLNADESKVE